MKRYIHQFQIKLDQVSSEKTRNWWQGYLKGVIPFRGVGIPIIRNELTQWYHDLAINQWPVEKQLELALSFFEESFAEDKLSGILILQLYLYDKFDYKELLLRYEDLFENEYIYDWNTCDWFCVRVLGPTIKSYGGPAARVIYGWHQAADLWQARSSVVSFVNLASRQVYYPLIETSCQVLIQRPERFAKTGVGWILREIFRYQPEAVFNFVDQQLAYFSLESLKNALKYASASARNKIVQSYREIS